MTTTFYSNGLVQSFLSATIRVGGVEKSGSGSILADIKRLFVSGSVSGKYDEKTKDIIIECKGDAAFVKECIKEGTESAVKIRDADKNGTQNNKGADAEDVLTDAINDSFADANEQGEGGTEIAGMDCSIDVTSWGDDDFRFQYV